MKLGVYQPRLLLALSLLPSIALGLTRDEVVAIAQSYVSHTWTATADSICHGVQTDGRRVDPQI